MRGKEGKKKEKAKKKEAKIDLKLFFLNQYNKEKLV